MNYFCTLFDSNYLSRGLAMYESLSENCDSFHLYVFAFDDLCFDVLKNEKLKNVTIISLSDFEDPELLEIKPTRSAGEYCWTCTPSVIKYAIDKFNLPLCTYLDADLYFFNDPAVLIEEMGDKSILITEHRYTPRYDQSATSGIYCVQFMTFKNDKYGMDSLIWWRDACLEWCYARFENGKFGDQKYLDDWPTRFENVHVLQHLGGGIAPWNIQQYDLVTSDFKLIFYHFHGLKFLNNNHVELGNYRLKEIDIKILYSPYIKKLELIRKKIENNDKKNDFHGTQSFEYHWKVPIRNVRRKMLGEYNIIKLSEFL